MTVLCLITNPDAPDLPNELVETVARETGGQLNWLARSLACEIVDPKSTDRTEILATARRLIGDLPVDACVVSKQNRRKKLLIADMDSTMIEQECIDELADALNIKPQVAEITAKAMRGELDFAQALATRVHLLKGLQLATIELVRRERITMAPGGRALVQTMKAHGAFTSLVSGGFTYFADHYAKRIGFDEAIANVLQFDDDVLTGEVAQPIVDSATKLARLKSLVLENGISINDTLAVGDGANDLPMIQAASIGVALHAKPAVAAQSDYRIDHGDLTALLYLQGYTSEEIVR